jgi:hypothetical protein
MREAERLEAKQRAEVADGRHRGTSARTVGELPDVYSQALPGFVTSEEG